MGEDKKPQMKEDQVKEVTKISYEQLENIAHQLSDQNRQLRTELAQSKELAFFRRLDYLFKVIEYPGAFPSDFYTKCAQEVESLMTIPEEIPTEESDINKA